MSAIEQKHTDVPSVSLQRKKLGCGLSVPPFFDLEWIENMKDKVKMRPDDVWIVTYPKSGSTWTQQIVRLIINGGKEDGKLLI